VTEPNAEAMAQMRKMAEKHAHEAGYVLNPIDSIKEATLAGLAHNLELYGRPFCSCQVISDDLLRVREKVDDAVCPCAAHSTQIAEQGCCHCGLFMTQAAAEKLLKARRVFGA
jgi:ferredoxin-thioredoxin reductase catalytic subunit